jgi:hypothetical protein
MMRVNQSFHRKSSKPKLGIWRACMTLFCI